MGLVCFSETMNAPIYIVHVSSKEGVNAIKDFKARGTRVYGETCPHYLVLDQNVECGHLAKVVPPLREASHQKRLWEGLRDGTLDTIGSDHCTSNRKEKEPGVYSSRGGFSGMETILPLLITEGIHKGRMSWEQLVRTTSENTARIFHMYPQKGVIMPGSDADVIIVDPEREWTLGVKSLHSCSDFSVYEGMTVKGYVEKTFIRGRLVVDDHRLTAEKPQGDYVYPM